MKTLIILDADPACWGSICTDADAQRLNQMLTAKLEAMGYDVQTGIVGSIHADTDEQRDIATRDVERLFSEVLTEFTA